MTALTLTDSEFRALAAQITGLAAGYLAGLDGARAYPQVSGTEVAHTFAEALPETGLGAAALGALRRGAGALACTDRPLLRLCVRFRRAGGRARGPAGQCAQPERHRLALGARGRDHRASGGAGTRRGHRLCRVQRQPVRRRLDGQPHGARHGARGTPAGQRARRAPRGGVRLLGSAHVDPQGHGAARTRAHQPAHAAR